MSLCKELAKLLNGDVWVESQLGKGSIFYFKFPKEIDKNPGLENSQPTEPQTSTYETLTGESQITDLRSPISNFQSSKTTILIVEDNLDLREYLKLLLSDYNVLTAENGQRALDILNSPAFSQNNKKNELHNVDLIISDLMMPVMDGFQFLETIKSKDRWRHLPVIMLTAKVNARAKLKALRIGVDDYLNKPFQEEELKARIENLLYNYRERLTLFSENGKKDPDTSIHEKPIISQVDAEWLENVESIFEKKSR